MNRMNMKVCLKNNVMHQLGILRVKAKCSVGILTNKPFLHQNSLGQPEGTGFALLRALPTILFNENRRDTTW